MCGVSLTEPGVPSAIEDDHDGEAPRKHDRGRPRAGHGHGLESARRRQRGVRNQQREAQVAVHVARGYMLHRAERDGKMADSAEARDGEGACCTWQKEMVRGQTARNGKSEIKRELSAHTNTQLRHAAVQA